MTKDVHTTHHAGDKIEMESYVDTPYSEEKISPSLNDDADLHTPAAPVGEGLQRNLQARHLTMISLGKLLFSFNYPQQDPLLRLSLSLSFSSCMVPLFVCFSSFFALSH